MSMGTRVVRKRCRWEKGQKVGGARNPEISSVRLLCGAAGHGMIVAKSARPIITDYQVTPFRPNLGQMSGTASENQLDVISLANIASICPYDMPAGCAIRLSSD